MSSELLKLKCFGILNLQWVNLSSSSGELTYQFVHKNFHDRYIKFYTIYIPTICVTRAKMPVYTDRGRLVEFCYSSDAFISYKIFTGIEPYAQGSRLDVGFGFQRRL